MAALFCAALFCFAGGLSLEAEDGGAYSSYAPYSIFGVGDIQMPGSAYNRTMGGVGIASRNNRFLNYTNPAAVTARDSLAFMSDFSFYGSNKIFRQGSMRSANNVFNINDFAISFPIYRSSAMAVGLKPYSGSGYYYGYYETNPTVLATVGNLAHAYKGQGSIYQAFASAGVTFFKRISLGAEFDYYFGDIEKSYVQSSEDAAALNITNSASYNLTSASGKFGVQYEQPLGSKWTVCLGATYSLQAKFDGYIEDKTTGGDSELISRHDTLSTSKSPVCLPSEIGVGLAVTYMDKLRLEFDYTRSDWSNTGFEANRYFAVNTTGGQKIFSTSLSEAFRFGMEYTPNRNDMRYYFKKASYRFGAYYVKDYFSVYGQPVYSSGITFGGSFPFFKWYNGITVGVDLGRRGSVKNGLIRETYVGINFGINLFDIWFRRMQYE